MIFLEVGTSGPLKIFINVGLGAYRVTGCEYY